MRMSYAGVDFGGKHFNLLQAHSHISFLGWVYLALTTGLVSLFLPREIARSKKYKRLFWMTLATLIGIVLFFIKYGYKGGSIVSLVAFLVVSSVFMFYFLRDLKRHGRGALSKRFVRTAGIFYFISSIALWGFGPIIAMGLAKTTIYFFAIYFYLHFLYNGFITFAIFGLLLRYLEMKKVDFPVAKFELFYKLMAYACVPAYFLSITYTDPHIVVYVFAFIAAAMQLVAFYYLFPVVKLLKKHFSGIVLLVFHLSIISFLLKNIMQFFSVFHWFADKAYHSKSYIIIGYLHLVTLGFISLFLMGFFIVVKGFQLNTVTKTGIGLFVAGIVSTESLLFLQGIIQWSGGGMVAHYHLLMLGFSVFLFLGVVLFFVGNLKNCQLRITN